MNDRYNSRKTLIIALIISIVLHFYAAYLFSQKKMIEEEKKSGGGSSNKPEQQVSYGGEKQHIWFSSGILPCDSYEGIGVQFNGITGIVTNVAKDGPAYNSGMRIGDEIMTPLWNMDLKFGQRLDVQVKRDSRLLVFNMVVDRICKE